MWLPGLGTQLVSLTDTYTVFLESHAKCSRQSYLSGCLFSVCNCHNLSAITISTRATRYLFSPGILACWQSLWKLWKIQALLHRVSGPKEPLENLVLICFRKYNSFVLFCFFNSNTPLFRLKLSFLLETIPQNRRDDKTSQYVILLEWRGIF